MVCRRNVEEFRTPGKEAQKCHKQSLSGPFQWSFEDKKANKNANCEGLAHKVSEGNTIGIWASG